jgi:hypothetical protein
MYWVMTPCRVEGRHQHSASILRLKDFIPEDYVSPKRPCVPTSLHGVTTQKYNIVKDERGADLKKTDVGTLYRHIPMINAMRS